MPTTKLLLTTNIDNLGIVGDVVTVKQGFARNYLLPRGMATEPTQGNIDRFTQRRKEVAAEMKSERAQQEQLLEKLTDCEITIERSANEYGVLFASVNQHDIAQQLRDQGFPIDDGAVRIDDQIKRLDSYDIPIVLARELKTDIKLWVVSDKPVEDLESSDDQQDGDEDQEQVVAEIAE